MHTPAHVLLAAAAFARPGARGRSAAAVAGGLIPDLSFFAFLLWQRGVLGRTPDQVFKEDYGAPFWQGVFAVDNSAPLWTLAAVAGLALGPIWLAALGGAALLHVAADLALHHDDARAHFQPITDWVFASPVSYWDPERWGWLVAPLELALSAGLAALLWRRFEAPAIRAGIAALLAAEAGAVAVLMSGAP